ncbi:hypothetical protein OJ996_25590 [Luteolibacter sp. GHJ8]|uniref:Lipoprotein n=1 Tax=Luteolibacter rhizosphaerae TaxID=2989719 RepID=A0ABT3GAW7_9BACT|nr:hypothetical protein [Luteolibacter rhizosphaerae]MCW1916988.1 hypothetical protein [Luteolibacter rhizosphaerae]
MRLLMLMLVLVSRAFGLGQGEFVPAGAQPGIEEGFAKAIAIDRVEGKDGLIHYQVRIYSRELTGPFPPSESVVANLVLRDEKGECLARTPASYGVMNRKETSWPTGREQPCMVMGFAIRASLEKGALIHLTWEEPVDGDSRFYSLPGKSVACEEPVRVKGD